MGEHRDQSRGFKCRSLKLHPAHVSVAGNDQASAAGAKLFNPSDIRLAPLS
jgi:hypothetical protein